MSAMAGYTKLFNSILASTIWREDDKTRIVWITMLAMADKNGVAESSIPGLADMARVSIADCEAALEKLAAPDKYSRTKEFDGRRIEAVDGGWRLLNHGKYRSKMSADERREYNRIKQAEHRAARSVNSVSAHVSNVIDESALSAHSEAAPEAKASPKKKDIPPSAGNPNHEAFVKGWCEDFKTAHGFDYKFEGGRDGKAVKELLSMNILVLDLLETAKKAWKRAKEDIFCKASKQASTIHGFKNSFNQIRVEVSNGNIQNQNTKPNPRNHGVCIPTVEKSGGESLGDFARRKANADSERRRLGGKVAEAPAVPPAS